MVGITEAHLGFQSTPLAARLAYNGLELIEEFVEVIGALDAVALALANILQQEPHHLVHCSPIGIGWHDAS